MRRGNQISRGEVLLVMGALILGLVIYYYMGFKKNEVEVIDVENAPVNVVLSPVGGPKEPYTEGIGPQISPQKSALNGKLDAQMRQALELNRVE